MRALSLRTIDAEAWHEAVARAARDRRFASLYAVDDGGTPTIRALFDGPEPMMLSCRSEHGVVPSIIDIVPAAVWDEREAHDLYGVVFAGHEPLQPLVDHRVPLAAWTVPVHGRDVHDIVVGPIHAGVIESGHFRFHVVGERILHLDLRLFYNHRGLERAAEGGDAGAAIAYAGRACAADHVAHSLAYAQAVESALGLWPSAGLSAVRTVLLELERVWNHLNDLGAICAGVGFAPGTTAFAALKERAQRLNHALAGHRFLFGTVAVAETPFSIDSAGRDHARAVLGALRADAAQLWRELRFNGSLQARLAGVGLLSEQSARALGAVGPTSRASGVGFDARMHDDRLSYDRFHGARPAEPAGDVRTRMEMRALELDASVSLLDELLARNLSAAAVGAQTSPTGIGASTVEGARGASTCVVELAGRTVRRLRLRSASYANWPSVKAAAVGSLLPDFPLINKSFELCYACTDR